MQLYHPAASTQFVKRTFNGKHDVYLPTWQHLPAGKQAFEVESRYYDSLPADLDPGYPYDYEPVRTASMEQHLKHGDVLFDIGVSDGWLSAIYAKFVGAENMCMFEPSPTAWPNIKAIWQANRLKNPRTTFCGFVSNKLVLKPEAPDHDLSQRLGWPAPSYSLALPEEQQFRGVKDRSHDTPQITIDYFVEARGIVPRGISIDVEGAEFLVLEGARETLRKHKPLVWLSVHTVNGALFHDYGHTLGDIFAIMSSCGYRNPEFLEVYGDEHWLFKA